MAAVAVAAGWAVHVRATAEVEAITAVPKTLEVAPIAALLASGDFKDQAQARRRLDELPPNEREAVLASLARSPRAEVRLMAVSALSRIEDRKPFGSLMARLAADDPDPDVRAAAQQLLQGAR
jgi:HEAT repeat protein